MTFWQQKKRWIAIIACWIIIASVLSVVAPHAKEVTSPEENNGLPATSASVEAENALEKYFPNVEGVPLFVVAHKETKFKDEEVVKLMQENEKIMQATNEDFRVIELSKLPSAAQKSFFSEDGNTFFMPTYFPNGMESKAVKQTMDDLKENFKQVIPTNTQVEFTGPAGIIADTYEMFSRADIVLMLSTVVLIFIILIIIYRSPILAFLPLIAAGISYTVVDACLGLMGKWDWFTIDGQSLSIMMILLFAVITDYSLLLFSRFREELETGLDVNIAMKRAINFVKEPIIFSGSTVFLTMLTLFFAMYASYRGFAPVFAFAVLMMVLAGLTLVPALFAFAGKKSFWPSNLAKRAKKQIVKEGFWHKVGTFVTTKPWMSMLPVVIILIICILPVRTVNYSFNLLDSFPKDMSSIQGYNILEETFSSGEIAPTTAIIEANEDITEKQIVDLTAEIAKISYVEKTSVQGNPIAVDAKNIAKINIVLKENPYTERAFDDMENLRKQANTLLSNSNITGTLHFAGETATNTDIRAASHTDEFKIVIIMTILIMILLGIQTRSLLAPVYMMATILLSYGAALGISVWFFQDLLGYSGISYRIPLYTFIFLVALGVDYSIMLISRIREEKKHLPIAEAVREAVGKTGGVISSAGLILAATFAVLISQPVMELRAFGFAVAIGVLIDTFLVRPIVIPAIITLLGKYSFWPKKIKK